MRLFGSRKERERPQAIPPMGSGRRLKSDLDVAGCMTMLEQVLVSYRPRKYREFPHITEAACTWHGPESEAPGKVVCCEDEAGDFLLIALWPRADGTELGIFPLGSGDARLRMSIVGHWKMRDPSLQSIGVYQAGLISLQHPAVTDGFYRDILGVAGLPATPMKMNLEAVARQLSVMILVKAQEFISKMESPDAAARFAAGHRWPAGAAVELTDVPNSMLRDLAGWNGGVLPYIQDLPWRCRAIMLENVDNDFWRQLER